jgi:hypothetical protein
LNAGQFIRKTHDPAVCVRAFDGNLKQFAAENVGRANAACNDGRPCTVCTGVRALRTAKTEFHDTVSACRITDPCGFGGDEALMVDDIQDGGLHQLCLHDRRHDFHERFAREDQRAFGYRIDIAGEFKMCKIIEKILVKDADAPEIVDILRTEVQFLDVLEKLLYAAHDRITAAAGIGAEKSVEDDGLILVFVFKVALHHRKFIQVCEKCQILSVHYFPFFR